MQNFQELRQFGAPWIAFCLVVISLSGCEKSDQIASYDVVTHDSIQTAEYRQRQEQSAPKPKRMIGVIIPRPSIFWFLKLDGPVEAVTARIDDVKRFVQTVQFPSAEAIDWTLPTGWRRLPPSEFRFATLVLDGEPPLELSVTQLPVRPDVDLNEQILSNLNRWRGQLSLPDVTIADLDQQAEKLTIGETSAYLIDLMGMGSARPAGMMPPMAAPKSRTETAPAAEPASGLKFDKPEGWADGPQTTFSRVSLVATDGAAKVTITVTAARGTRLDNVNRWRGQLALEPQTDEQLAAAAKKVEVGSLSGELFELSNQDRTILGVIVDHNGQVWFVKLDGDKTLAEKERDHFESFLKSLRLE